MEFVAWPSHLSQPINPMASTTCARAQSILTDVGNVGPFLPYEQARDVVAWHESHLQRQRGDTFTERVKKKLKTIINKKDKP